MKLHFEPNLDFQLRVIEAVCNLFRNQAICRAEFTVTRDLSMSVFHDKPFANDVAKTNLTAILEQRGLENVRSL